MFTNLRNAVVAEIEKRYNNEIETVKNSKEDDSCLLEYITDTKFRQLKNEEITLEKAQDFVIKKITRIKNKKIEEELSRIESVENAREFDGCTVSIEWKSNRTWGSNPTATLTGCGYIGGRSIGGCGYDKESTAVADVLNRCLPFKKKLYELKENNIEKSNHGIFGYGSGYGIKPYIEGGTGVSCMRRICESIGFEWVSVSHGRSYDVYEIRRKEEN